MDAWQILDEHTATGDAWTRLNELNTKVARQQVYEGKLVTETIQSLVKLNPIADNIIITIE